MGGSWSDFLRDDMAGATATAQARALLAKVDAEARALNTAITSSYVRRVFRRAWHEFLSGWLDFIQEEAAAGPHPYAARQALSYRAQIADWRRAFERERVLPAGSAAEASSSTGIWGDLLRDDAEVGALFYTPGAIKAEMETVDGGIKQLDSDIMASKAREPFKRAWKGFVEEWQRFYKANAGWWSRSWGSTYEKTVEFRKRVDEWRQAFTREGGQATGPALTLPEEGGGFPWKTVLFGTGGLIVVGALVGSKLR